MRELLEIWLQLIFLLTLKSMFSFIRGGMKTMVLGGVCESELETPAPSSEIGLAPN